MCCVCRTRKNADELIRIAWVKDEMLVDPDRKAQGRGAHLCLHPDCVMKCIKTRALNRSFKTNVPQSVYEDLQIKSGCGNIKS